MKDIDKLKLRHNCRELVANINVADIQDYLYEHKVLNEDNLDTLINEKSQSKAARRLIVSILPRKGPEAYQVFCDALDECGAGYLVELLQATEINGYSERGTAKETKDQTKSQVQENATVQLQSDGTASASASSSDNSDLVQKLARENTELKRQLSFYEENGARASLRKTSSGSRSSGHSLSFDHSYKGSDSGLSEVDSEELYAELDDGEAFDCADGGEILTPRLITTFCDDETSGDADVFEDNVLDRGSAISTAELQEILAEDIVDYTMTPNESHRNPQVFNKSQAAYILALRKATDQMSEEHGTVFEQLSDQVNLGVTWREIHEQMKKLYDKFFEDKYQHDDPLWGKIVAICTLTGYVAKRCKQIEKVVLPLGQCLGKYMNKKLKRRIEKMGGWVGTFTNHMYIYFLTNILKAISCLSV